MDRKSKLNLLRRESPKEASEEVEDEVRPLSRCYRFD